MEALPLSHFAENEFLKLYGHQSALNDFLATTVFDIHRPYWRPVSTQVQLHRQADAKTSLTFYGFFRKAILCEADGELVTELCDQIAIKRYKDCVRLSKPFSVGKTFSPHPAAEEEEERLAEEGVEDRLGCISEVVSDVEKQTNEVTRKEARTQLMTMWSEMLDEILSDPIQEIGRDPFLFLIYKVLHRVISIPDVHWEGRTLYLSVCKKLPSQSASSPSFPPHSSVSSASSSSSSSLSSSFN